LVLSTQNNGKYLSRSWAADRADAVEHPGAYTATELAWLEVPAGLVPSEYFLSETTPVDPAGVPTEYDIRDPRYRPEVGE
jgi:hypothetical protein